MTRYPPHQLIDDFLPAAIHAELLAYTLANASKFQPTTVTNDGEADYKPGTRQSWACADGLGPLKSLFKQVMETHREALLSALGMPPFDLARVELELVAHRHGSFFRPHIDTLTSLNRSEHNTDRMVTTVYYFHRQPKRFTGGELALFPFGAGEPILLEPADNRLVAFPSFAMHEVKPIACPPEDDFADARFAVNCWLHRARASAQS